MRERFIEFLKRYDFSFVGSMFAIFVFGVLNLYSATHAEESEYIRGLWKTQSLWFVVSIGVAIVISIFSPKTLFRLSYFAYLSGVFLLILTLILGKVGMGAQRWLVVGPIRLQPSEFMKVVLVMALSRWYSTSRPEKELGLRELVFPFLMTLFPAVLVMLQPDLGTGMLFLLIFALISFYHRLKWKTIILMGLLAIVSGVVMYNFGLKEYQKKRILTFINPTADARGSGYNAIQSEIAIGSGRLIGKGFMKSSQASLSYLPENHTDFVFSIYNEEHGFLGSIFLISLFLMMFLRFVWLSTLVNRFYDALLVIGLMSIFFWHTFINMGMVMGLLPIVGVPLPMMSYGGSSLLTFGICIGLATSVSNSRSFF